jgi:hypothetical protein
VKLSEINDPKLRERLRVADFLQNRRHAPDAINKPNPENGSVAANAGEGANAVECFALLKICCFRCRSLDDDNPFEKYFVDALRYAGAIFDDKKEWCKIEMTEQLVENRAQERTEIEIAYMPKIPDTSGD